MTFAPTDFINVRRPLRLRLAAIPWGLNRRVKAILARAWAREMVIVSDCKGTLGHPSCAGVIL